jgi:NAD(P)-dependent dehydrogenase (short-subunit alcohol dehydrogenase family)
MTAPWQPFAGRTALVTGAASGIGAACARLLAERGATVIGADLRAGEEVYALDVSDEVGWLTLLDVVQAQSRRLDIVVHAAGVSAGSPLVDTTYEEWKRVLATNLDGAFLAVKHGIGSMRAGGGVIVLIGSASGTRPAAGAAAYSTSKAGLAMLARTAAKECREAKYPIRVNVVSPAGVKTPMWSTMPFFQDLVREQGSEEGAYAVLAERGGRFAEPLEVAESVCWLASDAAGGISGVELLIDGGYVL